MPVTSAVPQFSWEDLGDDRSGRQHLGPTAPVRAYRLLYFSLRAVLIGEFGVAAARTLLRQAGQLAGQEFCRRTLDTTRPVSAFLAQLQERLREERIALLRVEEVAEDLSRLVLSLAEDVDCSGVPPATEPVCHYEEGFIAGVISQYAGGCYEAREIACWALGDRVCRYEIVRVQERPNEAMSQAMV